MRARAHTHAHTHTHTHTHTYTGEIPCLPEDATFYSAARTLADHRVQLYDMALGQVCWAGGLQTEQDFKLAAVAGRFRWLAECD